MQEKPGRETWSASLGDAIVRACDRCFAGFEWTRRLLGASPIESLSTAQVQAEMAVDDPAILLVDVRSEAEQSVSIIPGAITQKDFESNAERYSGKTIVPYCTVGGRSYLYARKLQSKGIPTLNYRDSILGWVRSDLPLETLDGRPTRQVHPYWSIFHVPEGYDVVK